ncbi:MAG: MASE3 domain-containing protein [Desulfonatronovibrio sp.]
MDKDINRRPVKDLDRTSPLAWTSWIILGLFVLTGLFVVSRFNYLLFHTLVEMFSVAVAWSVFVLVWNARHFMKNDALLNLGTAYLFIGFLDLLHTLAYQGMGVFAGHWGINLPTQLWVAGRYMEAAALLFFALLLGQRVRIALPLAGWSGVTALLLLTIFVWRIFPDCFVDGVGLTPFKIGSEYLICLILLAAMVILRHRREIIDSKVYRLMLASMLVTILAELSFTLYVDVYGIFNQLGHYFKLISFLLIYLALIQSGLRRPFALLFRALGEERAALHKSEALFRKVFEILPIGLWIADKNGKLIQGNPAGVAIWGAEPHVDQKEYEIFRARRLPSGEEIAPDDWALASTVNKGETIVDELLEIDAFDGKKKIILNYTAPILDSNGEVEGAVVVNQDITERKMAEDEISLINQQLEKVNAEKDQLFSIIAHDLKSPMAGIFNTSQILAQEAESLPRDELRFISTEMYKSSKNALELLNDLMQWSRMNQGGMDFSPEECSLYELARTSLYTARDVAEKKNVAINCDIAQDLVVLADQPMINTVFRNVIFNAIKFTPQGGNIYVTAKQAGSLVEVCVHDEGIGMNDAILSSIFSIDKSKIQFGTEGEKGTGLGLILCKEFVEKHGGKIRVESQPGEGTKVFFTLTAVP